MRRRVTRGRAAAAAVALLTVAGVIVLTGIVARHWWRADGGRYAPRNAIVRTAVTPARSLFGQVLTARAAIVVDPGRIDPRSVDLRIDVRPFSLRSATRSVGGGPGRAALVVFRYELQCIARACLPPAAGGQTQGGAPAMHLRMSRLTGRARDGRPFAARVAWPAFAVQSRLTADEIAFATPRIEGAFTAPPVSWAISPDLLGALAVAAASLLLLGAGAVVASVLLRDKRLLRARRIPAHLTPIERALALAEHAAAHGEVAESRKALERLAGELRRGGADEHAGDAERLAWSLRSPSSEAVSTLADSVRSRLAW